MDVVYYMTFGHIVLDHIQSVFVFPYGIEKNMLFPKCVIIHHAIGPEPPT